MSRAAIRGYQRDQGREALGESRRILEEAGIDHTLHIRAGGTADEIVACADELGVDEIVLGADGLGAFGRLWFRLLAAQIIRKSTRPVMIVKSPPRRLEESVNADKLRPAFSP